ncbi:hypothetical protein HGRIS_000906 [Hohenbuehelia grisea]|uniref:Uncharacterized protein n=1 Tax=Hohenbuehelia grisea TaxID=104357 RepID=A0ABR3IQ45_9AGAR
MSIAALAVAKAQIHELTQLAGLPAAIYQFLRVLTAKFFFNALTAIGSLDISLSHQRISSLYSALISQSINYLEEQFPTRFKNRHIKM